MFLYNLEDIARKLQIDYQGVSKRIEHNGIKGSLREDILKSYIRALLPTKYSVTSGVIMDCAQSQSKQQDCIIYDSFSCPNFFKTETNTVLPIESVYATIEIKSSLDYATLEQSVYNIQSVRRLKKFGNGLSAKNIFSSEYPLGFVFSYTSSLSLEKLQLKLTELNKKITPSEQLSIVCILDKGLIFNVRKNNIMEFEIIPSEGTILGRSESGIEKSLYAFYLFFLEYINSVIIQVPSLVQYAINMNALQLPLNIPTSIIPDDAIIKEGPFTTSYGDTKQALSINQKYPHLYDGEMSLNDFKEYFLSKDFFKIISIGTKMSNAPLGSINIYGLTIAPQEYMKLLSSVETYSSNTDSTVYFDSFITKCYEAYLSSTKKAWSSLYMVKAMLFTVL